MHRNFELLSSLQCVSSRLRGGRFQAQKIFQEVGDKAAESVACVHLAQAEIDGCRGKMFGAWQQGDI